MPDIMKQLFQVKPNLLLNIKLMSTFKKKKKKKKIIIII